MTNLEKLIETELDSLRINETKQAETEKGTQEGTSEPEEAINENIALTEAEADTTFKSLIDTINSTVDESHQVSTPMSASDAGWNQLFTLAKKAAGSANAQKSSVAYYLEFKKDAKWGVNTTFKKGQYLSLIDNDNKFENVKLFDVPQAMKAAQLKKATNFSGTDDKTQAMQFTEKGYKAFLNSAKKFGFFGLGGRNTNILEPVPTNYQAAAVGDLRVALIKCYIDKLLKNTISGADDKIPADSDPAGKIYSDMLKRYSEPLISNNASPLVGNTYITSCVDYYKKNTATEANFIPYVANAVKDNIYKSSRLMEKTDGMTQIFYNPAYYSSETSATDALNLMHCYDKLESENLSGRAAELENAGILGKAMIINISDDVSKAVADYLALDTINVDKLKRLTETFKTVSYDTAEHFKNGTQAVADIKTQIQDIKNSTEKANIGLLVNQEPIDLVAVNGRTNRYKTPNPIKLPAGATIALRENGKLITDINAIVAGEGSSNIKAVGGTDRITLTEPNAVTGTVLVQYNKDAGKAVFTLLQATTDNKQNQSATSHTVAITGADGNVIIPEAITGVANGQAAKDTAIKFTPTFAAGFEYDSCETEPTNLAIAVDPTSHEISFTMPDADVRVIVKAKATTANQEGTNTNKSLDALDTNEAFKSAQITIGRRRTSGGYSFALDPALHDACSKAKAEEYINKAKKAVTAGFFTSVPLYVVAYKGGISEPANKAVIATIDTSGNVTVTSDLAAEAAKLGDTQA